jgi:hypothetical protein
MTSGTTISLQGVWGSSESDVFAVGAGAILRFDGNAWAAMPSGANNFLFSVWGSSESDVFAVGAGAVLRFNGSTWVAVTSPTPQNLFSVSGSSGSDVFAVGAGGAVLRSAGSAPPGGLKVVSTKPAAGASGVDLNTKIQATFSAAMDPSSITDLTFTVEPGVTGSVDYDATSKTATFTPSAKLTANKSYTATIKGGVKDAAGNALASDYTWKFTTGGGDDGCFIATAVYGSALADEVVILREFRDKYLLTHGAGKGFVSLYYRYSPSIAHSLEGHETIKVVTRVALTPIVYSIKYPMIVGFILVLAGFSLVRKRKKDHKDNITAPSTKGKNRSQ